MNTIYNNTFQEAIRNNDVDIINVLLGRDGVDIHANDDGALSCASYNGHTETVKLLLDRGANVHTGDDGALRWASNNGHTETVKLLLDRGANVHANDDWALCLASENGHTEIVKLLLDRGANVHANDDLALRWASENGHTEIVKLLLDRGANIHANDDGALSCASYNGHTETVKLLLDRGANVHTGDDRALRLASENGHTETVKLLKEAATKPDTVVKTPKEEWIVVDETKVEENPATCPKTPQVYTDCVFAKGCYEICEPYEHMRNFQSIIPLSQWEAFLAHCKKEREDPYGFSLKDGYSAKVVPSSSPDFEAVIRWERSTKIDTDFFDRITRRGGQ